MLTWDHELRRLRIRKGHAQWQAAPSHRPPRLQSKVPGKHHECIQSRCGSRCRCARVRLAFDQRWRCGSFTRGFSYPHFWQLFFDQAFIQDPTLKRCFGVDAKIVDCTWEYIQTLRTVQSPHEPMPRLDEFLEWLASPGLEHIWVILDIKLLLPTFWQAVFNNRAVLDKLDSYADSLFHAIAVALAGVQPALGRPWRERVSVGCWAVSIPHSFVLAIAYVFLILVRDMDPTD